MPSGGELTVTAKNIYLDEHYAQINIDAKAGDYILLTVADTGTGIAPEIQKRIFDPFFTTKDIGEGTGLGLSVSYGIIKDHGGEIRVESQPGGFTRFTISLPAQDSDDHTVTRSMAP